MKTIQEMRDAGLSVFVTHYRRSEDGLCMAPKNVLREIGLAPANKGCITRVVVKDGNGRFVGISRCHENDHFNRKTALKIALGRALKQKRVAEQSRVVPAALETVEA